MLILLDRDGVLNEQRSDYVKSPDELRLILGAAEAVADLCRAGYRIAVVTNQSCIGRGIIDTGMLSSIHQRLGDEVARAGGRLDGIFHCPDPPWAATERRKPGPGMLREALARFGATAAQTPMIGDSLGDLEAAAALSCPRILVRTGSGAATQAAGIPSHILPVAVYRDLADAARALIAADS